MGSSKKDEKKEKKKRKHAHDYSDTESSSVKKKDRNSAKSKKKLKEQEHSHDKHRQKERAGSRDRDSDDSTRDERRDKKKRRTYRDDDNIDDVDAARPSSKRERLGEAADLSTITPEASSVVKSGVTEISIEETNKLRAKLGLKPLEVDDKTSTVDDAEDDTKPPKKEDIHAPAKNIGQIARQEKMKEKLEVAKEKRRIHQSLREVTTLADQDEEESTEAWVEKLRKAQHEKELAAERAKMLEQMDEEFGVSDLIKESMLSDSKPPPTKPDHYTPHDLSGLKVQHKESDFGEGRNVILTLKDSAVLENEEDILESIDAVEREKAKKNVEQKKKTMDYNPYEDDEFDQYGNYQPREILKKYKEEIEGVKMQSFTLGTDGAYNATEEREKELIRQQLRSKAITLEGIPAVVAAEYYTPDEMVKFKKTGRKKKIKKRSLKADDLVPLSERPEEQADHGSRHLQTIDDDFQVKVEPNAGSYLDEPERAVVNSVLERARRIKSVKQEYSSAAEHVASLLSSVPRIKQEPVDIADEDGMALVLDTTAEFCRQVGGNMDRKHSAKDEDMDFSDDGGHSPVIKRPQSPQEKDLYQEPEPVMAGGVSVALEMATRKGFIMTDEERKKLKEQSRTIVHSDSAKNYYREEREKDRDWKDKDRGRDRDRDRDSYRSSGSFPEKKNYCPDVKVEYVDEFGRMLEPKEAFRQMSHKFHGKGSGRKKTEKKVKKLQDEFNLQSGSGLNTMSLLQERQRSTKTPYLLLSGAQALSTGDDLGKN